MDESQPISSRRPVSAQPAARGRYHWSLIIIHWVIVLLVLEQYLTSFAIVRTHQPHLIGQHPSGFDLLQHTIHNRVGLLIVGLMILRFGLRWRLGVPPPIVSEGAGRASAARIVHHAFYAILVLQGVTGAIATYFWWPMSAAHQLLFKVTLALATIHVLAVAYHHLKGHRVLKRILPFI